MRSWSGLWTGLGEEQASLASERRIAMALI